MHEMRKVSHLSARFLFLSQRYQPMQKIFCHVVEASHPSALDRKATKIKCNCSVFKFDLLSERVLLSNA